MIKIEDRTVFETENVTQNMILFKTRLIRLRKERNLTQEQLSNELGFTRSAIASWEAGTRIPDIIKLRALSCFFNVSSDFLLGLSDHKHRTFISLIHKN